VKRVSPVTVLMVGLFLVASACGGGAGVSASTSSSTTTPRTDTTASNIGGDGLPVQVRGETYGHHATPLSGRIELEPNGCWTIDLGDGPRLAIFPEGYVKDASDATRLVATNAMDIVDGVSLDARGGLIPAEALPAVPDGYWGGYLAFCKPVRNEVVVLDSVEPAFDPAALGESQLVTMLREADLSVSWPCGIGFAASSADQRVAISLAFRDTNAADVAAPVTIPDGSWSASVTVGKHLMANNCDDVMEGWEPLPLPIATWPISAAQLTFSPPESSECGSSEPVTAALSGAVIATPLGDVELGEILIVNDAYGCFAG
jgi:hypothetical protein